LILAVMGACMARMTVSIRSTSSCFRSRRYRPDALQGVDIEGADGISPALGLLQKV
jgi:hypothetical protein